ncbi:MAG: DUF4142 domain-containing protein [Gemmatimonadaceae bacterium]
MDTKRATLGALTALMVLAVVACGGQADDAMDTTAMGAPGATDTAMTAGGAADGVLTDANVVYILDQANASDSARGALAQTKGTSDEVKSYGTLMMGEHHALRVAGQDLAAKLGVTPQEPAGDQGEEQAKAEMDSLQAMTAGAAWDKAYIDFEVDYHQAVLETATKALEAPLNAELADLIRSAAPTLQRHLDRAREIQAALAG